MRRCNRTNFFAAIRIVIWQFLYYSKDVESLSPEYLDCPVVCPDTENHQGFNFCNECPRKELKELFKADCIEFLNERAKGWQKWGFDELFSQAMDVFDYEQLPLDQRTVTCESLINILISEREKMRKIDEWNRRKP